MHPHSKTASLISLLIVLTFLLRVREMKAEQLAWNCVESLETLRREAPRVHCITNLAAVSLSANTLLALGSHPSTTTDPEEMASFTTSASSLCINIGTLDSARRASIPIAIKAAKINAKPWVFDPVMAVRAPTRWAMAEEVLGEGPPIVRGNHAEVSALGIEPMEGRVVASTGPQDFIADESRAVYVDNGHALMNKVTAIGCAETAVIAAFCAVRSDPFLATVEAITVYNIAGEIAGERAQGPGSFTPHLLDALYHLSAEDINARIKVTPA